MSGVVRTTEMKTNTENNEKHIPSFRTEYKIVWVLVYMFTAMI